MTSPDDDLAAVVDLLETAVASMAHDLQQLTIQVARGNAGLGPGGDTAVPLEVNGPPWWNLRMAGQARRRAVLEDLTDWLGWLHEHYPLAEHVPGCWWRHPEVVQELVSLRAAWAAAYDDAGAGPQAPAEWHDRWLPGALARVASWGTRPCVNAGVHVERPTTAYGSPMDDPPDFARFLSDIGPGDPDQLQLPIPPATSDDEQRPPGGGT